MQIQKTTLKICGVKVLFREPECGTDHVLMRAEVYCHRKRNVW